MASTCLICGREWKVSPGDPVPCLTVSQPHHALDAFRGEHIQSIGAKEAAKCPQFLELFGAGQEIPTEIERRVPGLSAQRDEVMSVIGRALRLPFTR